MCIVYCITILAEPTLLCSSRAPTIAALLQFSKVLKNTFNNVAHKVIFVVRENDPLSAEKNKLFDWVLSKLLKLNESLEKTYVV